MLYTRKGDDGTTKTFGCNQRISKNSIVAEALGTLDELNAFLGICKVRADDIRVDIGMETTRLADLVHGIQETLFIAQAELAGADKRVPEHKIGDIETIINCIEVQLPPITSFFIAGGSELAALFDFARTIARRAERRAILVHERGGVHLGDPTKAYLNRLSSALYAFARLSNHLSGIKEQAPTYR